MSDRDFSLRLPVPVIARPRRPLSISASTASCSIRFSLRTMISGAPSSRSRLSRLLRLITRRYRSLRSEVANRPPSSWTIGRSSGGMTGRLLRIIQVAEAPDLRKASTTLSRLIAFCRFWPEVDFDSSRRMPDSWSRSMRASRSWMACAPMPALKTLPNFSVNSRNSWSESSCLTDSVSSCVFDDSISPERPSVSFFRRSLSSPDFFS